MTLRSVCGPPVVSAVFWVLQDYIASKTQNRMSFIGLFSCRSCYFPRTAYWISSDERRQRDSVAG
jgi:hypothetical protein